MKSSGKQVSAPWWVSSPDIFLLRPPAQDTPAYDVIARIIAVYIHFITDGFISQVLLTICLHCINAVVALRVIR